MQSEIAKHLEIQPSQWSRMKNGNEAISDIHLARLSEYFDVERTCDFLIWTKSYDAFVLTLTTLGYGRLRYRATGPALEDFLIDRAEQDPVGLRIVLVESPLSARRGIGARAAPAPFPIELRPGDLVRIVVSGIDGVPHLVLLTQEPSGQFTVLAPLASKTAAKVTGPETPFPSENDAYPVGRPFGPHFLYAILSKGSLGLENSLTFNTPFPMLSTPQEDTLRDEIAGQGEENTKVRRLPYEVIR